MNLVIRFDSIREFEPDYWKRARESDTRCNLNRERTKVQSLSLSLYIYVYSTALKLTGLQTSEEQRGVWYALLPHPESIIYSGMLI